MNTPSTIDCDASMQFSIYLGQSRFASSIFLNPMCKSEDFLYFCVSIRWYTVGTFVVHFHISFVHFHVPVLTCKSIGKFYFVPSDISNNVGQQSGMLCSV